ncbi:MAG: hypothetical protein ABSG68_04395 [Thermoguttaceae bacterium]|jgi:hypothetical protein
MDKILIEYELNPTTWVYLSSLIMIAVYFKFHRFWSVRNLDLIGLIAFAPGLLLVNRGADQFGYIWLFCVGACFLVRLLLDPLMVRRPLLEPNLSASGLTFMGVALLVFLMCKVATSGPTEGDLQGARWIDDLLARRDSPEVQKHLADYGPGYPLFYIFAHFAGNKLQPSDDASGEARAWARWYKARTTAILGHLALVIGIVLIGYRHFDNIRTGVAAAALYLLLPYTAQMTPHVDHIIPAALLVWAVEAYRRPVVSGLLLGLAGGVVYYPLYLLPLWCSFYWRRGLVRFSVGVALALLLLAASLAFTSSSLASFVLQLRQMFGARFLTEADNLTGFWRYHEDVFRFSVLAAFVAMCASMTLWPTQKNLGTLLSLSAAVMLGVQFWKAHEGGLYMAWYLPLVILTILRPNLEDRVALSAISEGWRRRRSSG